MNEFHTHYSDYDVINLMDEWDSHTKEIVKKRIGFLKQPSFFNQEEILNLKIMAGHIICDNREDVLKWIIYFIDSKMTEETGEDQRKEGVPQEKILVRRGLQALNHVSQMAFNKAFNKLDADKQIKLLADLQLNQAPQSSEWLGVPQKEFFNKIATLVVSAYYSHPIIWSEIGYGGPAYPRGYVSVEFGLTDPWEARTDGK